MQHNRIKALHWIEKYMYMYGSCTFVYFRFKRKRTYQYYYWELADNLIAFQV